MRWAWLSDGKKYSDKGALVGCAPIFTHAPFRTCHASTIVETPGGLVSAWFGGSHEGRSDVCIYLSKLNNGIWSAPQKVADGLSEDGKTYPTWNPVLFYPIGGPLMLFYKVGRSPQEWWGAFKTSTDNGLTWSSPKVLPKGILGPIKNKPIQLPSGGILCGSSSESGSCWRVHFELSTGKGEIWTSTEPLNEGHKIGAIQPSLLKLSETHIVALGRTRNGKMFEMESTDGGHGWGPMKLGMLPNPNSGTDAITLQDGRHLLVYNHNTYNMLPARGRSPLNIALSVDGKTWHAALVIEDNPLLRYGFAYPSVIQSADGLVHITYTHGRRKIMHAVIDPKLLRTKQMMDGNWPRA